MSKICVTGGAGYIGDAVVEELLAKKHEVIVIDNLMYGGSYMRGIGDDNLKFYKQDITDHFKLAQLIDLERPDVIIHLAAIVGDAACQINPQRTIEVNEEATHGIADLCSDYGIRLVFASTCSVYGANNELLNEESPTNPLSLYAGTKLNSENYIKGLDDYTIFRLGTLYGISSEHARIRSDLVANVLTFKAVEGKPITVFGGEQWRPLVHVRDAAWGFVDAALSKVGVFSGTYILSDMNIQIKVLAEDIVRYVGKGEITTTDIKFEDLRNYKVDNSWIKACGFSPMMPYKMAIIEMADIAKEGRIANVWSPEFHNAQYIGANYAT